MRRRYFLIILSFFQCLCLLSQSIYRAVPDYDFIFIEKNNLVFPNGDPAMEDFYDKLDKLIFKGEGKINILHIGGSHVQAGSLSHQIRTNLLTFFPNLTSSRGYVFPLSAAKTNNPYNYKTTYNGIWQAFKNTQKELTHPLGLGMLIASQDSFAEIAINMRNNDSVAFDFNKVHLLGHCDSGYVSPLLFFSDSSYVEGLYDSSKKSHTFHLPHYVDSFLVKFIQKDSLWEPFFVRGFVLESDFPGISCHAVGVNGASVPSYLKCELFENDLSFINPDVCIFGIGINDASGSDFDTSRFILNYDLLIRRIKNVNPHCAFIFITNNDSYKKTGRRSYAVNSHGLLAKEAFYTLAQKHNGAVWDLFSMMGGLKSMQIWQENGLAQKDKIHFTAQGYQLLGNLFYNAFIEQYIHHLSKD